MSKGSGMETLQKSEGQVDLKTIGLGWRRRKWDVQV